jgi:hypothetical protein
VGHDPRLRPPRGQLLAAPVPLHNLASAIDLRFGDDEGQARSVVVCLRIPYLIMVCLFPWLTILARSKSVIAAELVTLRHDEQDGPPLKQQGVDADQVGGEDAVCWGGQELSPGGIVAAGAGSMPARERISHTVLGAIR